METQYILVLFPLFKIYSFNKTDSNNGDKITTS